MAKSFVLDDGGDGDTALSIVLLILAGFLSVFTFKIGVPGLPTFYPAPLFILLLTRWAFKRHFRKLLNRRLADVNAGNEE